jgi:type I restriction enzyme S subunit
VSTLQTERPLGELCEFQRGLTYRKSDEVALSESVVLRANNIDLATNSLDFSELRYIAPSVQVPESKRVRAGALLICTASGSKSHLGKVAYVDADYGYAFGGFMGQLVPARGVEGRYLFHALTSARYKSFIDELSDGLNINNLKFDDLRRFQIPVPGVEEQRRIVTILDEAFQGIATAKAHAERNLRNAREFFESRLREVFSAASDSWAQVLLGDVCNIARGGSPRPIKEFLTSEPDGINWVKISDATASEKYIFATAERIKAAGVSRSRLVHDGDFLLSNSMSFGRPYIMRTTGCIHDGWLVLSNYQGTFCQDFLYLLLGSSVVYRQFDRLAAGSTVRNLNIDLASSVRLPAPPLHEQIAIAAELDELGRAIDQLSDVCRRKVAALDELKQSLLHQAFSGAL